MMITGTGKPRHSGTAVELLHCQGGEHAVPPRVERRPACTLKGDKATAANRAVVRRFIEEVLGRGDFAALNALTAPDCIDHAGAPGPAAIAQFLAPWRVAIPDLVITIDSLVAAGDRVAARWTLRGTHRGPFLGLPPTDRPVAVTGMELYRLAAGTIVERWAIVDTPGAGERLAHGIEWALPVGVAHRRGGVGGSALAEDARPAHRVTGPHPQRSRVDDRDPVGR